MSRRHRTPLAVLLLAGALGAPGAARPARAQADGHAHAHGAAEAAAADVGRLGRVAFANSGAAAAQPAFRRGLALLHSFLHREARAAFREAQRLDPGFAMAYWGELRAAEDDSARVDSIFARLGPTPEARLARAPTERERDYLRLAERFGRPAGGAPDSVADARAEAHLAAWRALHARYPADDDAALFYALALTDRRWRDRLDPERSLRAGVEGAAVAEEVFRRRPDHPGAAHYLIHLYDDARLAPLGLRAARAYARIAPGASHALHMPSHIFFHYGLWDEVAAANRRAWAASKATTGGRPAPPAAWDYHAANWLGYAYAQRGELARARALEDSLRAAWTPARLAAAPAGLRRGLAAFPALLRVRAALETAQWDGGVSAADLAALAAVGADEGWLYAARRAAARGDRAGAEATLRGLEAAADSARRARPGRADPGTPRVVRVVRALAAEAAGRRDTAVALLRAAADSAEARPTLALAEGPDRAEAGTPRVLLGELLLAAGRPAAALAAYERALALSPGRSAALLGRARALARLGRADEAAGTYARLAANWGHADAGLPGLAEARAGARAAGAARSP